MYKLVWVSEDVLKECVYLTEKFHFNKMPKPFEEITEEQFYSHYDTYSPQYQGFGQICNNDDKKLLNMEKGYVEGHYYFYTDIALARVKHSYFSIEKGKTIVEYKFYKIGCNHDWEVTGKDAFEINLKCKKCGCVTSQQTGY